MHQNDWLSPTALQKALLQPIHTAGFQRYRRQAPYFMDYLAHQLKELYSPEALSSMGLTIYTTLDTMVQRAAEAALTKGLQRLERIRPALRRKRPADQLQGAIIVLQPKTGAILAMVGGRSYAVSQFNRIAQAKRQPGSLFKPLVFLSALDQFTVADPLSNTPKTYTIDGKPWLPRNFKPSAPATVSLREALAQSMNVATVNLAMQVGLEQVVADADRFEFSTPLEPYPALALGAFEMIPLELARAYCVFAADGVLPYLLSVTEVMDEAGDPIERRHLNIQRVTSPAKAYLMTSLLRSVVTDGTARSLATKGITYPVAGKTGTTNDYRDAWFVGYTPNILALIWVGFDNGRSMRTSGAVAALPIWADLMRAIPHHISNSAFRVPDGITRKSICLDQGHAAPKEPCANPQTEVFLADQTATAASDQQRPSNPFKKLFDGVKNFFKRR